MTIQRADSRRGLIGKPLARRLSEDREPDFVALNIIGNGGVQSIEQNLEGLNIKDHVPRPLAKEKGSSKVQTAMEIRVRLGYLLKWEWESPGHQAATVLARSMNVMLHTQT